jgi:hypothetical protein
MFTATELVRICKETGITSFKALPLFSPENWKEQQQQQQKQQK